MIFNFPNHATLHEIKATLSTLKPATAAEPVPVAKIEPIPKPVPVAKPGFFKRIINWIARFFIRH